MPKSDAWPPYAFDENSAWGKCLRDFLRRKFEHSGSKSTLDHYQAILRDFFTSTNPPKQPDQFTRADVEQYIHSPGRANGHIGRPPSAGTINNRLSILNSFYKYVASYTIPAGNGNLEPLMNRMSPTAGLEHLQRDDPPYRALTTAELHRFFDAIPRDTVLGLRDRALFLTYFFTARRRNEITSLRWGDIEYGLISEGHYGWRYHFRNKGRKRRDDMAELPPPVKEAIDLYLQASGKLAIIQPSDPIFTTVPGYIGQHGYDPHRPLAPNTVWHAVKRYALLAGLDPKRVTVHSFRHSAARIRYEAGSDIREIQQLLRHSSLAVTDVYLREPTSTADPGFKRIESKFKDL